MAVKQGMKKKWKNHNGNRLKWQQMTNKQNIKQTKTYKTRKIWRVMVSTEKGFVCLCKKNVWFSLLPESIRTRPSRPTMRPLWMNVFYEWMFLWMNVFFTNECHLWMNKWLNEGITVINVCFFYWVRTTFLLRFCLI